MLKDMSIWQSRDLNRIHVFNYIWENRDASRIDISRGTGLSKPTVSRIIKEFIDSGIVEEVGTGDAENGRKPIQLRLKNDAFYAIGVSVTKQYLRIRIIDLHDDIVYRDKIDMSAVKEREQFLATVSACIASALDKNQDKRLIGIGIGVPGIVDYERGVVIDLAYHDIQHIGIKDRLERQFEIPVFVDNNANTRALAEYWLGYGIEYENVLAAICSRGIGAGIITGGAVLRGQCNITGEFGHMVVDILGRECTCGKRGCIESCSTTWAVERAAAEALGESHGFEQICRMAREGDEVCAGILDHACRCLAVGLSNMMEIVNPGVVVLSGDFFAGDETLFDKVAAYTAQNTYGGQYYQSPYRLRMESHDMNCIGSALLVYQELFKSDGSGTRQLTDAIIKSREDDCDSI